MGDDGSSRADDEGDDKATSGLPRVVWFRQMLHRWQSSSSNVAAARRSSASGDDDGDDPGASADRNNDDDAAATENDDKDRDPLLPRVVEVEERGHGHDHGCPGDDAAEEGGSPMTPATPDAPADVPRGCCPVYVGAERRRFVVPTAFLGMPVFRRLLEKAEEEFEFHYCGGGVTIPCDTEAFKYILVVMDRHRQGLVDDEGNAKDDDGEQDGASSQGR